MHGRTFTYCRRFPLLATILTAAVALGACAEVRTSDPRRTATEQFLMTKAAEDSIEPLGLEPFADRRVFVEARGLQGGTADERNFMVGQLRARLLEAGARLVPTPEQAEVVLELRSAGLGIDRNELKVAAPPNTAAIAIRVFTGVPSTLRHPEINIASAHRQWGAGSAALVAYWQDTGDVAAFAGPHVGRSQLERWNVILLGGRTVSDIPPTVDPLELDTRDLLRNPPPPEDQSPVTDDD